MTAKLEALYQEIGQLEQRVSEELQLRRDELKVKLERGKVVFDQETRERHRKLAKKLYLFLYDSGIVGVLVMGPVMYSMIVPLMILDVSMSVFQGVIFSYYRIPRVTRSNYVVIDRNKLEYLNYFEKLNCAYCGYANGLIAYVREILARTEKHWCPIRHAHRTKAVHSQYRAFLDYGDAETYRAEYEEIRERYDV
jgi:hypothetical protein